MDIYLHLKYNVIFPKHRVVKILLGVSILSVTIGSTVLTLQLYNVDPFEMVLCMTYVYLVLDLIVLLASIVSFSYMLSKVWTIISTSSNLTASDVISKKRLLARKCVVPCLIITTYIVFNLSSSVTLNLNIAMSTKQNYSITYPRFLIPLGLMADCFIYIFMQHQVRAYLKTLLFSMPYIYRPRDEYFSDVITNTNSS